MSVEVGPITPNRRAQKFVNNDVIPVRPVQPAQPLGATATPKAQYIERPAVNRPQTSAKPSFDKQQKTQVLNRTVVAQPNVAQTKTRRAKRSKSQIALVGLAAVVLTVGITASIMSLQTNKKAKAQVTALSQKSSDSGVQGTSDVPSETKPQNIGSYQVAPSFPKYLKIPSLGVNARVISLGVNTKNELAAPTSIYDTGWYNGSAKPGDSSSNGAILIDGHVHGPTQPGVFSNIKNLHGGDIIQIQRGDNQLFQYKVVRVQSYDAKTLDMRIALASAQLGEQGLNLITCGGKYDRSSGYSQRTIVFAVLQK